MAKPDCCQLTAAATVVKTQWQMVVVVGLGAWCHGGMYEAARSESNGRLDGGTLERWIR